jgi:hypothetical protein
VLHKSGCARVAIGDSVYRALVFVRSCLTEFGILPVGTWKSTVCAARRGGPQVKQALRITSFNFHGKHDLLVIRITKQSGSCRARAEILTLGEGFNTLVITQRCFNIERVENFSSVKSRASRPRCAVWSIGATPHSVRDCCIYPDEDGLEC